MYEHYLLPAEVESHMHFDLHDKLEDKPNDKGGNYNQVKDLAE